jgi:L-seryl-tRNA(Ser) seleniumtransferase
VRPPSVDRLARSIASTVGLPHALLVEVAREAVAAGDPGSAAARARELAGSLLQPVVNATGVLLHTNLGRAPVAVSDEGRAANLELDLATGRRGRRHSPIERLLSALTGAEAALVVNNGAAAVLLALAALARGRRVVVSRGELVEIGGGFRIPEIVAASGCELVEVGTTNRTRLADYSRALGEDAALLLKVHQSNYRMVGFTEAVAVRDLARLGPPVLFDIGSGLLDATTPWLAGGPPAWLAGEPAARQALEDGAALVTFSGDKLLGGPQAGILAGRRELVEACGRHPLYRALRPGRLVLAALQETLLAYLRRDATAVRFWQMAQLPEDELRRRARAVAREAGVGEVVACRSVVGGGSAPGAEIPSAGVAVDGDLRAALRRAPVPVIARMAGERTLADLRTVRPEEDAPLAEALRLATRGAGARAG